MQIRRIVQARGNGEFRTLWQLEAGGADATTITTLVESLIAQHAEAADVHADLRNQISTLSNKVDTVQPGGGLVWQ